MIGEYLDQTEIDALFRVIKSPRDRALLGSSSRWSKGSRRARHKVPHQRSGWWRKAAGAGIRV